MRMLSLAVVAAVVILFGASPLLAADSGAAPFYGTGIAAGLGAGYGFGKIGSAALESMARQPETAGAIQTAMLIIAALLEGATFFSLIVCIIMGLGAAR